MKIEKVTVIGLGLIGGSVCRAVKKYGVAEKVAGYDADGEVLELALREGIIDEPLSGLRQENSSGLVVIANYVDEIAGTVEDLIPYLKEGAVMTDVGSVKSAVVRSVEELADNGILFIGSHPIAGKETSGIANSDPDLFNASPVITTPTEKSNKEALDMVTRFWESLGANVISLSPEMHDKIFAYVSHLPHVVAYSLINTVSSSDIEDIFSYSGGGLKDYTRIASSSPEMWKTIFMENKDSVLESIEKFKRNIELIESAVKSNDLNKLQSLLEKARDSKLSG